MFHARSMTVALLGLLSACSNVATDPAGGNAAAGGAGSGGAGGGGVAPTCLSLGSDFEIADERYCYADYFNGYADANRFVMDVVGTLLAVPPNQQLGPVFHRYGWDPLLGLDVENIQLDAFFAVPDGVVAYAQGPLARVPGTELFAFSWETSSDALPIRGWLHLAEANVPVQATLAVLSRGLGVTPDSRLIFSSELTPENDLLEGLYQSAISASPPALGPPELLRAGAAPGPVAVDARGNVFALMDDQVIFMFADPPNATLVSEEPGVIWLSAWSAPDASHGLLLVHYQNRVDAAAYTIEKYTLSSSRPLRCCSAWMARKSASTASGVFGSTPAAGFTS